MGPVLEKVARSQVICLAKGDYVKHYTLDIYPALSWPLNWSAALQAP